MRDPGRRRLVGGIYLSFLLPALMSLFAQVGGTAQPKIWRTAFIVLSVVGCGCALRLLGRARRDHYVTMQQAAAALFYGLIVIVGTFPGLARHVGLLPIQTGALLLIVLVALAHALAWRYMAGEARAEEA